MHPVPLAITGHKPITLPHKPERTVDDAMFMREGEGREGGVKVRWRVIEYGKTTGKRYLQRERGSTLSIRGEDPRG